MLPLSISYLPFRQQTQLSTIFSLLFQYSCLHSPSPNLPHPIVMVKADYGEINVCMITWLGLSHMKKVTECKSLVCMACAGFIGQVWGEASACWMKTRTRISDYWFVRNEVQI